MNCSSVGGLSVHMTVNLIIAAKLLNAIVGQPMTKSMDRMTEQMAKWLPPSKQQHGADSMAHWHWFLMMLAMLPSHTGPLL
jgi:hypothetical protein